MSTFKVKHLRTRKNKLATPKPTVPKNDDLTLAVLKNAVERSTSANRNFFISFLVILLYLLIIVASTTDYQLLIPNSKIKLPFVDVDVSLIVFYLLAPIIVMVGHFNMLQNLESHHHKLLEWKKAYKNQPVPRALIEPFLYDYALLEVGGQLTGAVRFFSRLLFLFLAPLVLLIFLWRFSDYQSLSITLWHLALLIADMAIIAYFQLAVIGRWCVSKVSLLIMLLAISESVLLGVVLKTETTAIWQLESKIAISQNLLTQAIQPLSPSIFSVVLPRISIDHTESLTLDDKPLRTQMAFDGASDFAQWFKQQKDNGWDLRKRNLKGAQLQGADLRHALLEDTQLQGARLVEAQLEGALLSGAQLQGAILIGTQLQGARLENAKLQGATLIRAQLQGADLFYAQLQGARLHHAQLQGTILIGTHLQGATLDKAHLQDAQLDNAYLQGSRLDGAYLQGGSFENTKLQGASLKNAKLQGASLDSAQLQGATLDKAQLQGATLDKAQLQGTSLDFVQLKGAFLAGIPVNGLKVQSAFNINMDTDATDWQALKALNISNAYTQRINEAIERVNNANHSDPPLFTVDLTALVEALPVLCKSDYLALQGSLKNANKLSKTPTSSEINVWQQLPRMAACQPHLEKIKQWGFKNYELEKQKILIPECWPNNKQAKPALKATKKPTLKNT